MKIDSDIVSVDFQNWPMYKKTLREVLADLGMDYNPETKKYEIDADNLYLDTYPKILHDDGMGYGVDEQFIIEVSKGRISSKDKTSKEMVPYLHIFAEPYREQVVNDWLKRQAEYEA